MPSSTLQHHCPPSATAALLVALAVLVPACATKSTTPPADQFPAGACTTEAKICPDGSGVGRTGPNCEFTPCPEAPAEGDQQPPSSPAAATPPTP